VLSPSATDARLASDPGKVVPVEPKAVRALLIPLRTPQKLITKEELLGVRGDAAVTENSLTRSIALLRYAHGDESTAAWRLQTRTRVDSRQVATIRRFGTNLWE